MSAEYARVYELTGNRITGPIAAEALQWLGPIRPGVRLLDIGAGAGALAIPAAFGGATVLAVDISPGMVNLLSERLAAFPKAEARVMDGQDLGVYDRSFDLAFSILGVSLFHDWRKGLREQLRVLVAGGRGCVATWRTPPGGGPFVVMAKAMRSVFPHRETPAAPEGLLELSDPSRLQEAMKAAGFIDVSVREIEVSWQGPAGEAYLVELHGLHRLMAPYAALDEDDRRMVDAAILQIVEERAVGNEVRITSPVLLATGRKPS